MDPDYKPTLSLAHPETMDFLSRSWCDFAVHTLQREPDLQERSLVLQSSSIKMFENDVKPPSVKTNAGEKLDDGDKFLPSWRANDVKSWIWMQQAMHPEVNYSSYFKRKWQMPWKLTPIKQLSIKKWMKEIKQRRKEDHRLQKAEVHAAISVAGVAAALAAIAAENNEKDGSKESAVASAAALVAAQCAKVAEAMGAKKEQLSSVIGSAISGTRASEIVTLTAAAATSIRGADTLRARSACKNRLNGSSPVLPIEDGDDGFDFEKCRTVLAKGADLNIETADGQSLLRSVAVIFNNERKVVLKMKKLNMLNTFARQKESIVLDWHAELYKDSEGGDSETGYIIVLSTNKGMVKLDMMDDYERYRTWSMTINHMIMLSTTFTKYELQFYKS